ncbi:MAG TPA: zinc-binding dehydrogenase, partial [Edaphobacter sp.]|nr:zinc-binding dehydrogenase [Edaphobacter sp.]
PYPLFTALAKYLTIRAYTLFELTPDPVFPKAKQYIFDHLASGAFRPLIGKTFPFAEIVAAHRYMESNAQVGNSVVTL